MASPGLRSHLTLWFHSWPLHSTIAFAKIWLKFSSSFLIGLALTHLSGPPLYSYKCVHPYANLLTLPPLFKVHQWGRSPVEHSTGCWRWVPVCLIVSSTLFCPSLCKCHHIFLSLCFYLHSYIPLLLFRIRCNSRLHKASLNLMAKHNFSFI